MDRSVIQLFRCPICHEGMTVTADAKVCRCRGAKPHCYDFARSGHLHLGGPHAGEGDSTDAIQARRAFLEAGYYQPLSDAVNDMLDRISAKTVLDAGCGEGYYTNRMATDDRAVFGIDLSRAGVEAAAKRARQLASRTGFAVASIFALPVQNASLDAVTNLFAPCAEEEFLRVLKPNGHLLLVGAGERHLMGLKQVVYDNPYFNPGRSDLPKSMKEVERQRLHTEITVNGQDMIAALFSMTPYYWRTSKADRAKLEALDTLTTEIDFDIFLFRKGL